jgi:hypothetical protein
MSLPRSDRAFLGPLYSVAGTDVDKKDAVTQLKSSLASVASFKEEGVKTLKELEKNLEREKSRATATIAGLRTRNGFSTNNDSKELLQKIEGALEAT